MKYRPIRFLILLLVALQVLAACMPPEQTVLIEGGEVDAYNLPNIIVEDIPGNRFAERWIDKDYGVVCYVWPRSDGGAMDCFTYADLGILR